MTWIYDLTPDEMEERIVAQGYPRFRSSQVRDWLNKGVHIPEDMGNLPKNLKEDLEAWFDAGHLQIEQVQSSESDGSLKYLIRCGEDFVEAVIMRYSYGNTLCLSSQIGCRMGCSFCASTGAGFVRNLTAGEMLATYAILRRESGLEIERVVIMGIGEPLENLNEVLSFVRRLHDEYGISKRRVTISTCGLVPQMAELAQAQEPVTLAISLHSAIQAKREEIMPIAKRYPLKELLAASKAYFASTGRRISYEYLMIRDFNDGEEDLSALIRALKEAPGHVNLIPLNDYPGMTLQPASEERMMHFMNTLKREGIPVSRRRSLGADIDAACGQLRRQKGEDMPR